jgi:hypothetical protein
LFVFEGNRMAAFARNADVCLKVQAPQLPLQRRRIPVMPKVFLTFHPNDKKLAEQFAEQFAEVLTPKMGGVSDHDDFIKDVNEAAFIEREIRERFLTNTTVTIMLAGKCTWSQRYVDWEIAASLRKDAERGRSALLGIRLPYMASSPVTVPERFQDNLKNGYAMFKTYPPTPEDLRTWIQQALERRDTVTPDNSRPLQKKNDNCKG